MPSPEDVRSALERVLASDIFAPSERLCCFLRLATEKSLAGEGDSLKEYLLGTEVFDRGDQFDPRLDPIVRVEARRLRAKLQDYYDGPGKNDPIRILLNKGSYAPVFEQAVFDQPPPGPTPPRLSWIWGAAVAVGLLAVALVMRSGTATPGLPIVVVPAFDSNDAPFADGLAEATAVELSRNPQYRVIAWPIFADYRRQFPPQSDSVTKLAHDLKAEAVLWISVRRNDDRRKVSAMVIRLDGIKQWAGEYERGTSDDFAVQREIARAIAEEVHAPAERK